MVGALAPSADPGPANACDGAKRSVPHVREGGAAYPLVRKPEPIRSRRERQQFRCLCYRPPIIFPRYRRSTSFWH